MVSQPCYCTGQQLILQVFNRSHLPTNEKKILQVIKTEIKTIIYSEKNCTSISSITMIYLQIYSVAVTFSWTGHGPALVCRPVGRRPLCTEFSFHCSANDNAAIVLIFGVDIHQSAQDCLGGHKIFKSLP